MVEHKGAFSRAICLSISKQKMTTFFIDYGNIETNVEISKCIKLPAKLLYTSCAIPCKVRGIELEIVSAPDETVENLENKAVINAELVEKIKDVSGHFQY